MTGTFITHRGAGEITRAELMKVPEPEFTKSWHPLSHAKVIDAMSAACAKHDLKIAREQYGANPTFSRMFGMWDITNGNKEFNFSIGIRNALDKAFAVGVCAGKRTFVCDNLAFSSDFVVFRKHTGMLDVDELQIIAYEAVSAVLPQFSELDRWHQGLGAIGLTAQQSALLICAAMRQNVIPAKRYGEFHELFYGAETKYEPTLHGFHGAVTELYRDHRALVWAQHYHNELKRFIDYEAPLLLEQGAQPRVDFIDVEAQVKKSAAASKVIAKEASRAKAKEIREKAQGQLKEARKAAAAPGKANKATRAAAQAKPKAKPKKAGKKAQTAKKPAAKPKAQTKKPTLAQALAKQAVKDVYGKKPGTKKKPTVIAKAGTKT